MEKKLEAYLKKIVTWSPTIYKVARIIKPNGIKRDFQKERYTLVNLNNYNFSNDFLEQLKGYLEFDDIPDDWSPSQI